MISFRPVVLCGGSGKRLWPISRYCFPKQFSKLIGEKESMLQASLRRLNAAGGHAPYLVSGNCYRFLVSEQVAAMGIGDHELIIEPASRNTAAAICASVIRAATNDPQTVLVVAPSDHFIQDEPVFANAVSRAVELASAGEIVTFGIVPDRAETGYGYIKLEQAYTNEAHAFDFHNFTEKPNCDQAQKFIESGKYLWNSGMFAFRADQALEAYKKYAPEILAIVSASVQNGNHDLDFFRLGSEFEAAPDISIDHAVMENVKGKVVPLDCGWNDLGSWKTVHHESPKDQEGNAISGSVTALDCQNSLIRSENIKTHIVGIGLENIAVVAMMDGVLVANMDQSQAVSDAVNEMRKKDICQADGFPRSSRPWGWFETLTKRQRFRVKSIVVKPDQKLSLQSHVHRAEHWIVVEGTAKVTIDGAEKMVTENESVFIPLGSVHRLENPGHVDLHLIEVQTGAYLEEDDIVRYEDIYDRS